MKLRVYKSEAVLYSDGAGSSGGCRQHNVAPLCARAIRHVVYSVHCVCTRTEINLARTVRTRGCLGEHCLKPPRERSMTLTACLYVCSHFCKTFMITRSTLMNLIVMMLKPFYFFSLDLFSSFSCYLINTGTLFG